MNGIPFFKLGPYPDGWSKEKPASPEEEVKQQKIMIFERPLLKIDMQSVRPLRATLDCSATNFDKNKLKELESQVEVLWHQLADLG